MRVLAVVLYESRAVRNNRCREEILERQSSESEKRERERERGIPHTALKHLQEKRIKYYTAPKNTKRAVVEEKNNSSYLECRENLPAADLHIVCTAEIDIKKKSNKPSYVSDRREV